jgi:hypothetical protein
MNESKQPPEQGLSQDELAQQSAEQMPDREAMTLLDLNLDLNLDADIAAPVDAAIAANANIAAPIDASVAANVVSINSVAMSSADQDSIIVQNLEGTATATATQDATIDQGSQ